MIPMLTSRYYILRILKSKDYVDLADALAAYSKFKQDQMSYAASEYSRTMKRNDYVGAYSAFLLPMC